MGRFAAAPLTLPEALRVLGHLRRLPPEHALSPPLLRVAFLRNRAIFFEQASQATRAEDAPSFTMSLHASDPELTCK